MNPEATFAARLMPHQEEGVEFLVQRKCGLLAFEQGLGKTIVAIAAFDRLRASGEAEAMAVVCPNSLKRNWAAELARFAPGLAVRLIEGTPKVRRQALTAAREPVTIISYETARAEIAGVLALLSRRRTVMVLDESHATKNRMSLTSIAAQHFSPRCEYRWLLSGTPVPNAAADLYAQLKIVSGGRTLGSFESFMVSLGDERATAAIRERIEPLVLRRTKLQCLDLPTKEVVDLRLRLPEWQRRLYDEMRDQLVCEIRMMTGERFRASAPTVLVKLLRLVQLASNPALVLPIPGEVPIKFRELDGLMDSLVRQRGEKVVIWTHYVATLRSLAERYRVLGAVALYGETPAAERQSVVRLFQEDPGTRVLLANPAAAGTGFTLTAARFAIYESLSWRYDLYAQSQDRIHRIGQERPVRCLRLIAADTVEEVIVQALERKSRLAKALLGDPEGALAITDLSPAEFCELLLSNQLPEVTA